VLDTGLGDRKGVQPINILMPIVPRGIVLQHMKDDSQWNSWPDVVKIYWLLVTSSIARSANLRVLNLLRGRFWGFSPRRGDTLHWLGWNLAWRRGPLLHAKFHPQRRNDKGVGPQKFKFLLRFDRNVKYKRPQGRIPCAIFTKVAQFVPHFRTR